MSVISYRTRINRNDSSSYNEKLIVLNIKTLADRRVVFDLVFLFKIVNYLVHTPELLSRVDLLIPRTSNRRSFATFYVKFQSTNRARNTPIIRMMSSFNKLLCLNNSSVGLVNLDIFHCTLNQFKTFLYAQL